ncbi:hypothetical protein ACQRXC_18245 [Niallia taxi]|uniref:Uncharacterized protein n=1 Tax=Niallia taxi TaxID=2499688 RepID=A0A3S2TTU5_9BACI|nr:hypothetical protein [Niallia taxi]RVT61656.1 hypothetical protein EM808_15560 [Niallia taxi]
MDDLGRSLNPGPNVAFSGGVGDVSTYLKAESRADGVGKVSGDVIKCAGNGITKDEYKNLRKKSPSNDVRKMVNP